MANLSCSRRGAGYLILRGASGCQDQAFKAKYLFRCFDLQPMTEIRSHSAQSPYIIIEMYLSGWDVYTIGPKAPPFC